MVAKMKKCVSTKVTLSVCEGGCLDGSLQNSNIRSYWSQKKIIDKQQLTTRVGRTVRGDQSSLEAQSRLVPLSQPEPLAVNGKG
jgi:hypothetical protein